MELRTNHTSADDPNRRLEHIARHVRLAREARASLLADPLERGRGTRGGDELDLSAAAQRIADDPELETERAALVESLKAAYEAGTLHTRERIEQAARRLLGE